MSIPLRIRISLAVAVGLSLAGCVAIDTVSFPSSDARATADTVVAEVWAGKPMTNGSRTASHFDLDAPDVHRLLGSMAARHPLLEPLLDSGSVGLSSDGYLAIRDAAPIAMENRYRAESLIADENADRTSLYRRLAAVSDQPQWESPIRKAFAERWVSDAKFGWFYQDPNGAWLVR